MIDEYIDVQCYDKSETIVYEYVHYIIQPIKVRNNNKNGSTRQSCIDRYIDILIYQLLILKLKILHNNHMSWLYKNKTDWRQVGHMSRRYYELVMKNNGIKKVHSI